MNGVFLGVGVLVYVNMRMVISVRIGFSFCCFWSLFIWWDCIWLGRFLCVCGSCC